MLELYYDTEANGLLPEVTKLHTIQAIDINTGEEHYFGPPVAASHPLATPLLVSPTGTLEDGLAFLGSADLIVAHNGYDYDMRMLDKLYPQRARPQRELDSLITAKLLWPYDMLIGPDYTLMQRGLFPGNLLKSHSLKAWGYRLGEHKDEYKGGFDEWSPEMAAYGMQDIRTGLKLWLRCLKRLGWRDAVPGTYIWPELPVYIEHEIARIVLQQTADGVRFNRSKAIELSRELRNAVADCEQKLADTFGSWWQPLDPKDTGTPLGSTMKRQMPEYPDVTIPRVGKNGKALKPYVGPPFEERDEGSPYCRVEWVDFAAGSREHLGRRLQDLYGWVPTAFGKDKKPKLDETVITEIPDYIVPKAIKDTCLAYFKITKTLGMLSVGNKCWINMIDGVKNKDGSWRIQPSPDGRMHGRMDTNGAITSRAIHKDPNLSQVPSVSVDGDGHPIMGLAGGFGYECRELFEADGDGWEQTGIDVTALELITLGHLLYPLDGGAFSDRVCDPERDPHTEHAQLTGVPRQETKTCTYLYIYGGSAWKLTFEIDITDDEVPKYLGYKGLPALLRNLQKRFGEDFKLPDDKGKALLAKARTIILKFEAGIVGIKELKEGVAQAAKRGYLKGLDGRKLFVRPSKAHAALAPLNQGNGSIVCKLWIIKTHEALKEAGLQHGTDWKQILWSHDEIQVTHRKGLGPQITQLALKALGVTGQTLGLRGQLRGAGKTGLNWAQCH